MLAMHAMPLFSPYSAADVGATSLDGHLVNVVAVNARHPDRRDVEAFIAQVYRARYGAELQSFLPHLLAFRDATGLLRAAVGLRIADEGPLFVEQYLDVPAEQAVSLGSGQPVARSAIVEVGNLAACSAGDARALIVHLTGALHAAGLRWVLFAATRQLRNTFDRLHLRTVVLADASADRLQGDDTTDWGSYYDVQPKVLYGDIAAGNAYLLREAARLRIPMAMPGDRAMEDGALPAFALGAA